MKIGFTGSQVGMSSAQFDQFKSCFPVRDCTEFHHGDCIGADKMAAQWVILRVPDAVVFSYPSVIDRKRAWTRAHITRAPAQPLGRNRAIVDVVDLLIAAPDHLEELLRSGTWSTVRYARKQHKPLWLVGPDGSLHKTEHY